MTRRFALLAALILSANAVRADDAVIELKPHPTNPMGYATSEFTVKAGQKVKVTFANIGGLAPQPHNFVLCNPGTLDKVGAAVNAMMTDPAAMAKNFTPDSPDILAKMKLVQPGQTESIEFTAPAGVGDYPFLCTFPGHWLLMRGVVKVTQ
jgi:azurin